MIAKGTWVRIRRIVLKPGERADNLPEDTKRVPLEMWVKGFLEKEADLGAEVAVKTATGRIEHGVLETAEPSYRHDFGTFVPEIMTIDRIVKTTLFGDKK